MKSVFRKDAKDAKGKQERMHCTMTYCRDCGEPTGRRYAKRCDSCRGWKPVHFTRRMDQELRAVYAGGDYKETGALGVLAKRWEVARWKVRHRAQQLGIAGTKEPRWSTAEVKILEKYFHLSPRVASRKLRERGYQRSLTGVVMKRKKLGLRKTDLGYSAGALAEVMGVDGSTALTWIHRGLLKAERLPSERPPGQLNGEGEWFVRPHDLRKFIIDHVALVDIRKCDKYWLVDLLTNKAADAGEGKKKL